MAFTFGLLSQVVFVVWDVVNESPDVLEDTFFAVAADMDIGSNFQDDRCSAIPVLPPGANNSSGETVETNLGFCWDDDFNEADFDPNPPGFVGITFFQGPIADDGSQLGLERFTLTTNPSLGRPQPDPTTDGDQYDLMGGIGTRAPFIDATASDMRFVEISGPITFDPGEIQRVVAGYIWASAANGRAALNVSPTRCFPAGAPCFLPDPNDPVLEELVTIQRAAQVIFDAGFLAPAPPPKPDMTLIPGDQQITIVWSDVSQVPDPFFDVAGDPTNPAFDPLFRELDFEGYVLVRSTSGDPTDVDTLGIFDLANGVASIDDTTFQTFTVGDTVVELPVQIRNIVQLPDAGLQFSFVDRGLINGIRYFYDVVPFDFNPSNTLRGPEITLSAGISFQPGELKSTRPRSDASSFRTANASFVALKADGTVCDTQEVAATVDPESGDYVDFVDCSNAILPTLTPLRDVNIPSGEFFFVVDSIVPNPDAHPYDLAGAGGYTLALGFNTVWFHWENADGSLAPVQPNVGSFDQNFDFGHASQTPVAFSLDAVGTDVGPDLSVLLTIGSSYSTLEDVEVNGQSLAHLELGGTKADCAGGPCESRPHKVEGSVLADTVYLGMRRARANGREYAHPGVYAPGAASYELTWEAAAGGGLTGTLRKLPGGEVVPQGGQPKGPENPHTPADFVAGYNWGFVGPGTSDEVAAAVFPAAGPLGNTISLNPGDSFSVFVPGQSVHVEGLRQPPVPGDVWTFLIDAGTDRAGHGRGPSATEGPFSYTDANDGGAPSFAGAIVNVYPGARWRLTVSGGSNDPANVDLSQIKVVPNPYVANAVWDFSQDNQRIEFTNLPPVATIRIYTISGNLVRVLEHTDGSGTEAWDLRTRFNLKAASGTYYWHVTTPEGETTLGLLSLIQNELGAN
jgi:hypothetical protein